MQSSRKWRWKSTFSSTWRSKRNTTTVIWNLTPLLTCLFSQWPYSRSWETNTSIIKRLLSTTTSAMLESSNLKDSTNFMIFSMKVSISQIWTRTCQNPQGKITISIRESRSCFKKETPFSKSIQLLYSCTKPTLRSCIRQTMLNITNLCRRKRKSYLGIIS